MSWRYDVHACNNHRTEPGSHDSDCHGWRRLEMYSGGEWFDAFLHAATLPHGVVIRVHTGDTAWGAGSLSDSFVHIAGGGCCRGCETRRGEMVHTADGPHFLCARCISDHRAALRHTLQFSADTHYRSLLDEARAVAAGRRR